MRLRIETCNFNGMSTFVNFSFSFLRLVTFKSISLDDQEQETGP